MSSAGLQTEGWPARRWWVMVGLVFTVQLSLIYWLGRPQHSRVPRQDVAPMLQLASDNASGLLALNDPTLFALPHQQGFSGLAWLTLPEPEFRPFRWDEPPRVLALNRDSLGEDFRNYMVTNRPADAAEVGQPELRFKVPSVESSSPLTTRSALSLIGDLAGRRLLVAPELPSWPGTEMISNSVVQVLVAADGRPISATLLKPPGSASTEADQYALRAVAKVRFEPVNSADPLNPLAAIALGQMLFEWHTTPLLATNAAPDTSPSK